MMVSPNKQIIEQKIENQRSFNIFFRKALKFKKKYAMPHLKVRISLFTLN